MTNAHPTARFSDLFSLRSQRTLKSLPGFEHVRHALNGRSAIYGPCRQIPDSAGNTVLIPAFHCPTVVSPVLAVGYKVRFYGVEENLSINLNQIRDELSPKVAAIIVIDYFGFSQDISDLEKICAANDTLLIRDCSHSFLQTNPIRLAGQTSDIVTYSFWKLIPSMLGGGIFDRHNLIRESQMRRRMSLRDRVVVWKQIGEQAVVNMDESWVKRVLLRLEEARVAGKQAPIEPAYNELSVEDVYPFDVDSIDVINPWICRHIIRHADLSAIAAARRDNYETWNSGLITSSSLHKLKPILGTDVCPWAYPVLLNDRVSIEFELRDLGVPFFTFGEKLHPFVDESGFASTSAYEGTHQLTNNMICFSVHQGLSKSEIAGAVEIVNRVCK